MLSLSFGKLAPRHAAWVTPLFLSLLMTAIVSLISTLRSVGFGRDATWIWVGAWALSWAVAFPVLLVILPLVRRLTGLFVRMR